MSSQKSEVSRQKSEKLSAPAGADHPTRAIHSPTSPSRGGSPDRAHSQPRPAGAVQTYWCFRCNQLAMGLLVTVPLHAVQCPLREAA